MSNDTFIREVNEELRQERARALWKRFGMVFIAVAVLIVLATVAYVAWQRWSAGQAAANGERLVQAMMQAEKGEVDSASTTLDTLASDGSGAYPEVATMRLAALRQEQGDLAGAVELFDKVANNGSAPQSLRDAAAVRAAYILVDTGSLDDVRARVERLTGDSDPMRFAAREVLGLAAWKAGDTGAAKDFLQPLGDDLGTPPGIARRARMILDLIAADAPPADIPAGSAGPATQPEAAPAPVATESAPTENTPATGNQPPA